MKRKLDLTGASEINHLYPNSRRESFNEKKYLNTLPAGGGWGKKRPSEDENKNVTRAWNGRAQKEGGGLTAPKRVRGAPKTQWEWKMLRDLFFFFFAAGMKNGWRLQGKLADGKVVEFEAGASLFTDPISDVRQMHMNVVKCSN
ncbi:hypothetical protein TNCV_4549141 [Trichonephila clavipes]|nr:hypothetical protein TNCV_4549141 [Trichonephila clavipes]